MNGWKEEDELVREEMRRVLAFLKWESANWQDRMKAEGAPSANIAYAARQKCLLQRMYDKFAAMWAKHLPVPTA